MESNYYFSGNLIIPENVINVYTTRSQARQINKVIKMFINSDSIITDATAGIGGNAIHFIKHFKKVNLIEKDSYMYYILCKNTNVPNFTYNCSYNWVKFMLKQDIVYFDPPWGGNDYKNKKKIDLYLDDINVLDIINEIYTFTKIAVLKVPNNFNVAKIDKSLWDNKIFNITKNKKCVYRLIVFYKPV
tara:strand:+ start:6082 stop:6645 length:564 start_codon:yes stop_codon:yes gene_type:complete